MGKPSLLRPVETTTVGNPATDHGTWNAASPVVFRSRGAGAGIAGVMTTSTLPTISLMSARNCRRSRWAFRYADVGMIMPISILARMRGP